MVRRDRTVTASASAYRDYSSKKVRDRVWREASREVRLEARTVSRRAEGR